MRKSFLHVSLLAMIFLVGISGCGGGGSADPLGTDSLTLESSASQVVASGTVVLTAKVTDAGGKAVAGREVYFGFTANTSGAVLTAGSARTNNAGTAMVLYQAGTTAGSDTVRASISNGATMSAVITVSGAGGVGGGMKIALNGSSTSLAAGQSSILTATLTDNLGNPLSGQTVAFSFISNVSSAPALTVLNLGMTDASGRAIAFYTAGVATPATEVQDAVQAEIAGVCTAALILTRTSSAAAPSTRTLTLSAGTSSLAAGQNSILNAKVTDAAGNPLSGQLVSFQFLGGVAAPSGAAITVLNGGSTDASGHAFAVYTAGSANPTATVQDTVQASTAGSTGAVIITRTGTTSSSAPPAGYRISLTADVTSMTAGRSTVVTAIVTDGAGNPAGGQGVTFSLFSNNSGAVLTTLGGTTDIAGRAVAVYTAGSASPTATVQDAIQASTAVAPVSTGAVIITRTASTAAAPTGYRITLTTDATSLAAGRSSIATATVTDGSGNPAGGQTVTFTLLNNNSVATFTALNGGLTDASGRAIAVYTAGAASPATDVQDTIQATVTGSTGAVIMTRTASTAVAPVGYRLTLAADVTSLAAGHSAVITGTVVDGSGNPASGQTVTFALLIDNSGAALTVLNGGVTDASGRAVAVYTAGANTPAASVQDTVQASVTGSTGAVVLTRTEAGAAAVTGVRMTVTATPTDVVAGAMSVIVAQVNNADGTAASGLAVTVGFVTNNSGAVLAAVNATTDAGGKAIFTYTAGNNAPGLSLQDAISASVTGSAGAAIITRLPATGTGNRISLTVTPANLPTTASNAVLQATVLRDDKVTPVPNETVTFSIITGGGAIAPLSVTTNNSGIANAVFTAPGGATGFEAVVRAQILGTTNGGDAVEIVYW